eukprot:gene12660-16971_t
MNGLLEVEIRGSVIVLPVDNTSTIQSVSHKAISEYLLFNKKSSSPSFRILYTQDSLGRILSGSLSIVEHNIDRKLVVIVEDNVIDMNGDEAVKYEVVHSPNEVEELYRKWQTHITSKIKDYIYNLSIEEIPPLPSTITLSLLDEISASPSQDVQLMSIRGYQLLLTKFNSIPLIKSSLTRISTIFNQTSHCEVAIAALKSINNINPLQFNELMNHHLPPGTNKHLLDVENTLNRFSAADISQQKRLFEAYESISSLINDDELIKISHLKSYDNQNNQKIDHNNHDKNDSILENIFFNKSNNSNNNNVTNNNDTLTNIPVMKMNAIQSDIIDNINEPELTIKNNLNNNNSSNNNNILPIPIPPSTVPKRINLNRLESLLNSDDTKIRQYSLEKLHKILTINNNSNNNNSYYRNNDNEVNKIESMPIQSYSEKQQQQSNYHFVFTNEYEVDSIIRCLFTCLKKLFMAHFSFPN